MIRRLTFSAPLALFCVLFAAVGSASATIGPQLTSPASSSVQGSSVHVAFSLPATPDPGTTTLTFTPAVGSPIVYGIVDDSATKDFSFPVSFPGSSAQITTGAGTSLPDGTYAVKLTWTSSSVQNELTNTNVVVKTSSTSPMLISPTAGSRAQTISISYSLPDAPLAGSTAIRFDETGGPTKCTLHLTDVTASTVRTFTLNAASPTSSPEVASTSPACSFPDGSYDVTLSYQDSAGNAPATDWASSVIVDNITSAPTLIDPATGTQHTDDIDVNYSLPEEAAASSVKLTFAGPSNSVLIIGASGTTAGSHSIPFQAHSLVDQAEADLFSGDPALANGLYSVTLSYQDDLGNPVASSATATDVRVGPAPSTQPPGGGTTTPPPAAKLCFGKKFRAFNNYAVSQGKSFAKGYLRLSRIGDSRAEVTLSSLKKIDTYTVKVNGKKLRMKESKSLATGFFAPDKLGSTVISAVVVIGDKKQIIRLQIPVVTC
jgi:hypothetical protein